MASCSGGHPGTWKEKSPSNINQWIPLRRADLRIPSATEHIPLKCNGLWIVIKRLWVQTGVVGND